MLLSLNSKNFGLAGRIAPKITVCQIHIKETSKISLLTMSWTCFSKCKLVS